MKHTWVVVPDYPTCFQCERCRVIIGGRRAPMWDFDDCDERLVEEIMRS